VPFICYKGEFSLEKAFFGDRQIRNGSKFSFGEAFLMTLKQTAWSEVVKMLTLVGIFQELAQIVL